MNESPFCSTVPCFFPPSLNYVKENIDFYVSSILLFNKFNRFPLLQLVRKSSLVEVTIKKLRDMKGRHGLILIAGHFLNI